MSEQLETIKCSDWTINFSKSAGGEADREGARLYWQAALHCFFFFFSPFILILRGTPGQSHSNPSASARLQPTTRDHEPDFYLLTSHLRGPEDTSRLSSPVPAFTKVPVLVVCVV